MAINLTDSWNGEKLSDVRKFIQEQLKDFADQNPELKPKNDPENKNDRPSY